LPASLLGDDPPAAAPALSSPLAIGSGGVDWGFRESFRTYVAAGDGNPPISTLGGAAIDLDNEAETTVAVRAEGGISADGEHVVLGSRRRRREPGDRP